MSFLRYACDRALGPKEAVVNACLGAEDPTPKERVDDKKAARGKDNDNDRGQVGERWDRENRTEHATASDRVGEQVCALQGAYGGVDSHRVRPSDAIVESGTTCGNGSLVAESREGPPNLLAGSVVQTAAEDDTRLLNRNATGASERN